MASPEEIVEQLRRGKVPGRTPGPKRGVESEVEGSNDDGKRPVAVDAAATALGIGLPPSADYRPPEDYATVHTFSDEGDADPRIQAKRAAQNTHCRFVTTDPNRGKMARMQERGYRVATEEEAARLGVTHGFKNAVGQRQWGDMLLMVAPKDQFDARKKAEVAKANQRLKRHKERVREAAHNENVSPDAFFGDVRVED